MRLLSSFRRGRNRRAVRLGAFAVLAVLALWRLQWSVMRVIGVCALAGLLLRWPGLG